jgi:hypothetical protein
MVCKIYEHWFSSLINYTGEIWLIIVYCIALDIAGYLRTNS